MAEAPILKVEGLVKQFPTGRRGVAVNAVNGVSFEIGRGETLGLVGESGSGKSTIGRTVLRLTDPTRGRIEFLGRDITHAPQSVCRKLRSEMQIVFQDPWSALNPRMRIGQLMEEPLRLHTSFSASERQDRTRELAGRVRLGPDLLKRFPNELSGGQLQRVCIARALATSPKLIVLDEPTSSLDLSVRAGIIQLLAELRDQTGVAMLFITHDLGTLQLIADRIIVLYLGFLVETATTAQLFSDPQHPYTQALMSAHLPADPFASLNRIILEGEIPPPIHLPPGCPFDSRCPVAEPACAAARPPLAAPSGSAGLVACRRVPDGGNRIAAPAGH